MSEQKKAYWQKLQDPRWQKKRLEVLGRDGWECQSCGATTRQLHVHHRYYVSGREPWEYPDWAFLTLCDSCHKEHQFKDDWWEILVKKLGGPDVINLAGNRVGISGKTESWVLMAMVECLHHMDLLVEADNRRIRGECFSTYDDCSPQI